jgi:sugar phosphate isomerase/epimerase
MSARIGLSTYSFFWQHSDRAEAPLTLAGMLESTIAQGATVFQICDFAPVESATAVELAALRARAAEAGVTLELGTRGIRPEHLDRYLALASALDVTLLRSMLNTADHRPSLDEAHDLLTDVLPRFAAAGVTLALETYEQVSTEALAGLVERVAHPNLGICLDPANSVAALENPREVIDRTADLVVNLHVKDFAFTRSPGWVGFLLAGAPLGEGLLDLDHLFDRIRPAERGISQVIEHWLPWQHDEATTLAQERAWTTHNLSYLRSRA